MLWGSCFVIKPDFNIKHLLFVLGVYGDLGNVAAIKHLGLVSSKYLFFSTVGEILISQRCS